jgi:hypothetical protein
MPKPPIQWFNVLSPEKRGERMVTLPDGREVSNYSAEWMEHCRALAAEREAHYVASLPTQGQRHAYILRVRVGDVEKKLKARGDAVANTLEDRARAIFAETIAARKAQRELEDWCG